MNDILYPSLPCKRVRYNGNVMMAMTFLYDRLACCMLLSHDTMKPCLFERGCRVYLISTNQINSIFMVDQSERTICKIGIVEIVCTGSTFSIMRFTICG